VTEVTVRLRLVTRIGESGNCLWIIASILVVYRCLAAMTREPARDTKVKKSHTKDLNSLFAWVVVEHPLELEVQFHLALAYEVCSGR
jgi:hypothetical protein